MEARWLLGTVLLMLHATALAAEPGPALAQNANFVVHAPTRELAEAVLHRAEALRDELAAAWLGETLPPSVGQALIHVKLSASQDKGLAWVADSPKRLSHIVWLTTSAERATGGTLAHEMVHVVLATRYPGQIPAWANEGAASLEDDAARLAVRRQILHWYARTGNWPSLKDLLDAPRIAPQDERSYALAASLTEFLLERGQRNRLLEFARSGRRTGWEAALRRCYGIDSLETLDHQWRRWVAGRFREEHTARRAALADAARSPQ